MGLTDEERATLAELDQKMAKFDAEAEQRTMARQADPTKEMYFLRMDRKTVVKTQAEYDHCDEHRVPMRIVSYNSAVDHLNKEEAEKRKLAKRRKHTKAARAQARMNRKKR